MIVCGDTGWVQFLGNLLVHDHRLPTDVVTPVGVTDVGQCGSTLNVGTSPANGCANPAQSVLDVQSTMGHDHLVLFLKSVGAG